MEKTMSADRQVKTRFAPSPTGFMHVGGLRTALYNYLFARKNNGKFIFRLEDTDRERFVPEAVNELTEATKWAGLQYDEGPDTGGPVAPYVQSERLEIYQKHANDLVNKGLAYQEEKAIRFKTPKEGKTSWHDLIGDKEVAFDNKTQEDFVILKSDGYPTYNFANVIDDHYMEITHVIRGPEFISSTPKHLMLYQAFGWQPPQFAHAPMILGTDRSKLSKRHGAKGVSEFRKEGYLPEALINFLALLGWTPPSEKEILTLKEMVDEFDINDVHDTPAVFDTRKLEWMNGVYIRQMPDEELTKRLQEYLVDHPAKEKIAPVVPLIKERITKLSDFIPLTDFVFEKPEYDLEVFKKISSKGRLAFGQKNQKLVLEEILKKLEGLKKPWEAKDFELVFRKLAEDESIKVGDMFQMIRVAVSGQLVTPPLFESIKIIGEDETLDRVKWVVEKYPKFI